MKNHLKLIWLFFLIANSALFAQKADVKKGKIDKKLVGTWYGSEIGSQREGLEKHWIQERYENGTYTIMFLSIEECVVNKLVEKGKWWVKDGVFYEYHIKSENTDVYTYTLDDDDHVRFKSKSMSIDFENSEYEFVDSRVKDE